jgi:hypothetical protein
MMIGCRTCGVVQAPAEQCLQCGTLLETSSLPVQVPSLARDEARSPPSKPTCRGERAAGILAGFLLLPWLLIMAFPLAFLILWVGLVGLFVAIRPS